MPLYRKARRIQQVWAVTIVIVVIMLAINAISSFRGIKDLVDDESRTSYTQSILRSIKDFYSSVQATELGLRAFLLTGHESSLTPYYASLDSIATYLAELKQYQYEIADQPRRVNAIETLIESRMKEMKMHVAQKRLGQDTYRMSLEKMQDSHSSVQSIHDLIDEMEKTEYQQLASQSQATSRSREDVQFTIIVANAIGLILVFGVAFLVRRIVDRQREEAEKLEEMVARRTEEIDHYAKELQRSNRELQDFAFVASHDLQEPLRKIRAFGDRLKTDYGDALGNGTDYLNRMQNAAARMSKLIEDLLTFSRVSTQGNPFQDVDLNKTVAEVLENLELKTEELDAQISCGTLPLIEADPSQMRQLFQNLIGNALKFVAPDTRPDIHISAENMNAHNEKTEEDENQDQEDQIFLLTVADNGIGFDERFIEKIFTPFQRLHGKDQYEGTGIGLAICRRIVERHNGFLTAKSQVGVGTTFTIQLPRYQPESPVSTTL